MVERFPYCSGFSVDPDTLPCYLCKHASGSWTSRSGKSREAMCDLTLHWQAIDA